MPLLRAVAAGAGTALAIAFPAALLAQILDALSDDDPPAYVFALVPVVLAGALVGGWVAGRRAVDAPQPARPWVAGALASLAAIGLVLAMGVARRAAADEAIAWSSLPALAALAAALGAGTGAVGGRPGRTRS